MFIFLFWNIFDVGKNKLAFKLCKMNLRLDCLQCSGMTSYPAVCSDWIGSNVVKATNLMAPLFRNF